MPTPDEPDDRPPPSGLELAPGLFVDPSIVRLSASRSSGPGGQNVNKVSTKVELRLNLNDLPLSERVRARLELLAARRINDESELVIVADEHRSQLRNKAEAFDRLRELLLQAKAQPKVRKPTKPTKGSKVRRLDEKKRRGDVKSSRRANPNSD